MPDHASPADSIDRHEYADGGCFAPLALARHMRITTFSRHGIPVSASVPGVADGDLAYFRAWNRSGTVQRLRHTNAAQAMPCGLLGFFTYGPPVDAPASVTIGVLIRQDARCADATAPTSLATVPAVGPSADPGQQGAARA